MGDRMDGWHAAVRRPRLPLLTALAVAMSAILVVQASNAAFTASTSNPDNSFSAGTVVLSDDDSGTVMFSPTGLKPGSTGSKCINVTYTGSLNAAVKLFVPSIGGTGGVWSSGLGTHLDWTVEQGEGAVGGASADCTGFSAVASLTPTSMTLNGFASTFPTYTSAPAAWSPAGGLASTRSYRFAYTLQDDNAAQGATATAVFRWEARSVPRANFAAGTAATSADTSCATTEGPAKAVDGAATSSYPSKWCATGGTPLTLDVDLGASRAIREFVIDHAEAGGEDAVLNTRDFGIEVRELGTDPWTSVVTAVGNTAARTTHPVDVQARYVRLVVTRPDQGFGAHARIYELGVNSGL